jgi:hypothetical protein
MCFTAPIHIKPRLLNTKKFYGYKVLFIDHQGNYRSPYKSSFVHSIYRPAPFVELVPSFNDDEIGSSEFSIYEGYHFFTNIETARIEEKDWGMRRNHKIFRIEIPIKTPFYTYKDEGIGVASSIIVKEMIE